jgi:hypothetical protein
LGPRGVQPRPIRKYPNILRQILPPTAIISTSDEAMYKSPVNPNKSKSSGFSAAWKGGALMSSPTEQSSKKSFEEKAQDWSIGVGTEHAMILLGELHKNESLCGIGREHPEAMPHQRQCHQSSKSRRSHPAPNQVCGAIWRRSPRTPAVIMTNSPLAPALARQQMAKIVAVITTIRPMPALARHQMAKEPAIIALAVIMTTHSMPALVRHQMAEG